MDRGNATVGVLGSNLGEDEAAPSRRHWCFLGEMLDFTTIYHLEVELKSVDGETIPLHFYTPQPRP